MDSSTEAQPGGDAVVGPLGGGDQEHSLSVYAWVISMLIVAGFAVAARFYTRGRIMRVLGREDWCILIAFLLAVGAGVSACYQSRFGLGKHFSSLTPIEISLQLRASWVNVLFYQLSLAFSKMSILFLYIRILTYDYARRAAWVLFAIVVVYNAWGLVSTATLCIPLKAYWDMSITNAKCYGTKHMWAAIGLHIGTDLLIFALPIPVVWGMKLPIRQKLGLFFVFAVGFFVCIISIVRAFWIHRVLSASLADPSYVYVAIANWSTVEVNTAIVCACLIVLKPLISNFWPRLLGQSQRSSGSPASGNHNTVLTIGTRPNRGPSPQETAAEAQLTQSSVSETEKHPVYDIEFPAGASDPAWTHPTTHIQNNRLERLTSANSLHHQYLAQEARESRRQSNQDATQI